MKSILVHYIYHKNEKGKPSEMDLHLQPFFLEIQTGGRIVGGI
jgi:hypothetical protein